MIILETIAVAVSMYSAIPVPQFEWNSKNMKYALLAFPLIGIIIGLLVWGADAVSNALGFPTFLRGALCCLIPTVITGGIHLDGFSDTCDALASHKTPQEKAEILKDPHVGAFAVISLCAYFIFYFALWSAMPALKPLPIVISFCLSRCLSGLSVAAFPLSKKSGLAYTFAQAADKEKVEKILGAAAAALILVLAVSGIQGIAMGVSAAVVFAFYYRMSIREFGGLSGDLAGWFLTCCELWMLAAYVLVSYLGGAK